METVFNATKGDYIWQSRLDAVLADCPEVQERILWEHEWTPQQALDNYGLIDIFG